MEGIRNIPFWVDLATNRHRTIEQLQLSLNPKDNFIHLLQNQVISNLDVPALSAETIDTAKNMYGVGFSYRGSSEASDDSPEFSLEFKDTRWLDVYYFFKTYEEYETLKHHGVIAPWRGYIERKIIDDQFSIYKFLIGSDGETILYYAKLTGCYFVDVPRSDFGDPGNDGFKYSISFHAQFVEDNNPLILRDFNRITPAKSGSKLVDTYNSTIGAVDNTWVSFPIIQTVSDLRSERRGVKYDHRIRWVK